jgi:hypothetical protein
MDVVHGAQDGRLQQVVAPEEAFLEAASTSVPGLEDRPTSRTEPVCETT